jgi:hypothetical protein
MRGRRIPPYFISDVVDALREGLPSRNDLTDIKLVEIGIDTTPQSFILVNMILPL